MSLRHRCPASLTRRGARIDRMIRGIDHLVIAVPDPDAAAASSSTALGTGVHRRRPHSRCRGRSIGLPGSRTDAYLELIGIDDPELAGQRRSGRPRCARSRRRRRRLRGRRAAGRRSRPARGGASSERQRHRRPVPARACAPTASSSSWSVAFPTSSALDGLPLLIHHEPAVSSGGRSRSRSGAPSPSHRLPVRPGAPRPRGDRSGGTRRGRTRRSSGSSSGRSRTWPS